MTDLVPAPEPQPEPSLALVKSPRRSGEAIIAHLKAEPTALTSAIETALVDTEKRRRLEKYLRTCAELVFAYWSAMMDHPRAIFDDAREKYIVRRLRENDGDVSELLYVIDGGLKDDWVMGRAMQARHKNDGISYLYASRERVEQLAERCKGYKKGEPHPMKTKYLGDVDPARLTA